MIERPDSDNQSLMTYHPMIEIPPAVHRELFWSELPASLVASLGTGRAGPGIHTFESKSPLDF